MQTPTKQKKKEFCKTVKAWSGHTDLKVQEEHVLPKISFGHADDKALVRPHDDALIINTDIDGYDIAQSSWTHGVMPTLSFKDVMIKCPLLPLHDL